MVIAMLISFTGIAGVVQNVPLSAQKIEDPYLGGEIKLVQSKKENATKSQEKEETAKPSVTKKNPLPASEAVPDAGASALAPSGLPPYKVKVTFNSVTVHNNHEGFASGDGEYDLNVYVHGMLAKLTDMSRSTGAQGLWDVSNGETVNFPAGSSITVSIDRTVPLSFFTVGSEVDGCGRTAFSSNVQSKLTFLLSKGINYLIPLGDVQNYIDKFINYIGCLFNPNDDLGDIVKVYNPTGYGAGFHADKSDTGDFTLRYTISVTPP